MKIKMLLSTIAAAVFGMAVFASGSAYAARPNAMYHPYAYPHYTAQNYGAPEDEYAN